VSPLLGTSGLGGSHAAARTVPTSTGAPQPTASGHQPRIPAEDADQGRPESQVLEEGPEVHTFRAAGRGDLPISSSRRTIAS
jgi:hypothetical protein